MDGDRRIIAVNQRFVDMTGFSREELVGTFPPHPYWMPDDAVAWQEGVQNAYAIEPDHYEIKLRRKDGTTFVAGLWVSPVLGPGGEPVGVIGLIRDQTAQRRIEARYRALVSGSGDFIVVVDSGGQVTFVSPAVKEVLGWDPQPLDVDEHSLGDMRDYVHPDDADVIARMRSRFEQRSSGPHVARSEVRARHADGSWRTLEVVASDLRADPSIRGYVFSSRDVTERREFERALRESEERFRTTVASLIDGLMIYSAVRDESGVLVDLMTEYANEAVVMHRGMPASEQIGRRLTELFPGVDAAYLDPYAKVIETGQPTHFEVQYRDDATRGLFEIQVTRLGDGCVVSFREVSEQRRAAAARAQLERERLLDQLHRAQRLETLGRLAAGVAHDFASSLAAIRNFASVVAHRMEPNDPLRRDVDQILDIAAQASSLTDEVLRFGDGAQGPAPLEPGPLVDEIIELVQRSSDSVEIVRGEGGTRRVLYASRGQLEQILVNLLLNACDASEPGDSVTVRLLDLAGGLGGGPGPCVGFEVADSGTGMRPDVRARALEPFFTTKARGQGSGLGLATVHGIAESLGGSVHIESEPGAGTTVLVLLPAVDPVEAASTSDGPDSASHLA